MFEIIKHDVQYIKSHSDTLILSFETSHIETCIFKGYYTRTYPCAHIVLHNYETLDKCVDVEQAFIIGDKLYRVC